MELVDGQNRVTRVFRARSPLLRNSTALALRAGKQSAGLFSVRRSPSQGSSPNQLPVKGGAGGRTRTPDLLITNQLLYQLSYTSGFLALRRKFSNLTS